MLRVPCLLLGCVLVLLCFHSPGLALGADVVPEPLSGAPAEAGSGPESGPSASPAAPTVSAASAADQASQSVQPDQQAQPDQGAQADQAVPAQKPGLERVTTIRGSFVLSPKSVIFSADGSRFYVNALEGLKTLVYDTATLKLAHVISHEFTEEDAGLFLDNESTVFDYTYLVNRDPQKRNCFGGKPVEGVLTHADRYLWVTYYRRTWDPRATSPSAVAIIDTQSNSIVRVMPTGPLPKMLAVSPDGRTLAITHWGDNSVALMDISSDNPRDFHYVGLLVDGKRPDLRRVRGDRDKVCGHCLRGTVFSRDGRHLFVGRMHNGGITVFDVRTRACLGTFRGVDPTPRHLVLSPDGTTLYVSCAASGTINALEVDRVLESLATGDTSYRGRSLAVGPDGRTLALSADGRWIYVACNRMARLVMVDALNWKVVDRVPASPYPVGLAVHPDGTMVLTTAQGRRGRGGHVLDVFRVQGVKPLPVQPPAERPAQDGDREPDETDDETDDEQHVDTLSTW